MDQDRKRIFDSQLRGLGNSELEWRGLYFGRQRKSLDET